MDALQPATHPPAIFNLHFAIFNLQFPLISIASFASIDYKPGMLARRRIAGLGVIVGVALAVRLWVVLSTDDLPPLGWLLLFAAQAAVGATIAAAVAFLAWSRLPERPVAGWLAAAFAAAYPPHIWLVTAPNASLWLALAVTALLIRPQSWLGRSARPAGGRAGPGRARRR